MDLMARKGGAAPLPTADSVKTTDTKSMTVKVDADRFDRLDYARYKLRCTGQQILSEALDMWLANKGF